MAKTYKRTYKRTKYKKRTHKRTHKKTQKRHRKQKRGGATITQTKVPSILLGPYRHSGEECIKKMIEATPPNELTIELNPAVLNTYAMLLLTAPNSITYRSQMKPAVKAFIDDMNKGRLLEYKQMHSKSMTDPKKMPPSIKGDLRQLNAAYVAEILSPDVNKNATMQDIIDWLTGAPQPTPTPPQPINPQPTTTQTKEKVLVLCQRKLDENGVELVNKDIDNLLDALNIGSDRDIKYVSPMDEAHVGQVDFEGEFGKNDFTKNNFTKGDYSVIILNTCPFRFMKYGIINEYLKPNGRIVLSKFDKRTPTNFVEQAGANGFYQRRMGDAKDKLSDAGFEIEKIYKDALVFRRK
jgi:hypothetical protein